ncbi:hypothetical protein Tco_0605578 [Tanacetum coccineum]
MAEKSCYADVVVVLKFDMQCHESLMTAKDVKLLARKYNVPLDLHPCAPTEGWTMDKLPKDAIGLYEQFFEFSSLGISPTMSLFRVFYKISKQGHRFSFEKMVGKNGGGKNFNETFSRMKGWKDQFFFIDRRTIPYAMAWRHPDSDVFDAFPDNDFSIQDLMNLTERIIDIRPVPPGFLFDAGLATTWDFPGFFSVFKDTGGNLVTMSEYLRFPFLSGAPIKAQAARAAAKKKESKKRGNDEGGSFRVAPVNQITLVDTRNTNEEPNAPDEENRLASNSPRGSVSESVHNFVNVEEIKDKESLPHIELFVNLSEKLVYPEKVQVFVSETNIDGSSNPLNCEDKNLSGGTPTSQPREILTGQNIEEGESSCGASVYVPG